MFRSWARPCVERGSVARNIQREMERTSNLITNPSEYYTNYQRELQMKKMERGTFYIELPLATTKTVNDDDYDEVHRK